MRLFLQYLRGKAGKLAAFFLFAAIFIASFALYRLPLTAVWYPSALCLALGLAVLLLDFRRVKRRHEMLRLILRQLPTLPETLPAAHAVPEEDYRALVQALCAQQQALETRMSAQYQDMLDYYTLWAHQIKTPIASMRLCLQQEDTPQARRLLQELSRAEQYVEMVMVYLRLTGGSDLVLREYELDVIVRRAVRRFAGEFIGRKLKLCYEPLNVSCVTDEKWLLFVIEQVLSNALKYTRAGSITIELEAPKTLVIRDTGIGIAPEDLPRIFEKGYTGYNGRGVRWDSDHVVIWNDELQAIATEIIHNGYQGRVNIGLDYFDASINRIACWVIGVRDTRKALLKAALDPMDPIRKAELAADEALTEAFLRLGVDELSVAPSRILPLREKIRSLTLG